MAKPNFTILGKIHRNEISISNKHKDTLDKLISLGYINNIDGEWKLTKIGKSALKKFEKGE